MERTFHLITEGYAGKTRDLLRYRYDEIAKFVIASLALSGDIRRDVIVKVTMTKGPMAPLTVVIRGEEVRGLYPDEKSVMGFLQKALYHPLPGVEVVKGIDLPERYTIMDREGKERPSTRYFVVGGPSGFPLDVKGERVSLGEKEYRSHQVACIVNYLLDVGVW